MGLARRPETIADLLERLGSIPPGRVRSQPPPGTAQETDLLEAFKIGELACELVDGVIVEKAMGAYESLLAVVLIRYLEAFAEEKDLGLVLAPDAMLRLSPGLIRAPDVSFVSWGRLPGRVFPARPIPSLVPDLAVEVLNEGNTVAEMDRKLAEYFRSGVRLVWYVNPSTRTVAVYTSPTSCLQVDESQVLDGGEVLPGFVLPVRKCFGRVTQAPQ